MQVIDLNEPKVSAIKAAKCLMTDGLIIYPTDTVYGIGANAQSQKAVDKLRQFKGNRGNKPISIAVKNQSMASQFVDLNQTAKNLYHKFLPGPLTVISNLNTGANALAAGVASTQNTVGIRIIPHPFVTELFNHIDFPLTATSGNISNGPNPRSFEGWQQSTPKNKQSYVSLFINAGEIPYRKPSTVIDTTKEDSLIIRSGNLQLNQDSFIETNTFETQSPTETRHLAERIIDQVILPNSSKPVIFLLEGNLGAGKTVFTQGIASKLGLKVVIKSPTYTLVKEYPLPANPYHLQQLVHIDAWRLHSTEEFADLSLEKYLEPNVILVLEWPQRLSPIIQKLKEIASLVHIQINPTGNAQRQLILTYMR